MYTVIEKMLDYIQSMFEVLYEFVALDPLEFYGSVSGNCCAIRDLSTKNPSLYAFLTHRESEFRNKSVGTLKFILK